MANLTGCQLCQLTGQCDVAYKGNRGFYCGAGVSNFNVADCCCPTGSICHLSDSSCNCEPLPPQLDNTTGIGIIVGFVAFFIFVSVCACWCCRKYCTKRRRAPKMPPGT
ncbi:hypothetical protein As57867_016973, partial [Aphanomyces stellatus]